MRLGEKHNTVSRHRRPLLLCALAIAAALLGAAGPLPAQDLGTPATHAISKPHGPRTREARTTTAPDQPAPEPPAIASPPGASRQLSPTEVAQLGDEARHLVRAVTVNSLVAAVVAIPIALVWLLVVYGLSSRWVRHGWLQLLFTAALPISVFLALLHIWNGPILSDPCPSSPPYDSVDCISPEDIALLLRDQSVLASPEEAAAVRLVGQWQVDRPSPASKDVAGPEALAVGWLGWAVVLLAIHWRSRRQLRT